MPRGPPPPPVLGRESPQLWWEEAGLRSVAAGRVEWARRRGEAARCWRAPWPDQARLPSRAGHAGSMSSPPSRDRRKSSPLCFDASARRAGNTPGLRSLRRQGRHLRDRVVLSRRAGRPHQWWCSSGRFETSPRVEHPARVSVRILAARPLCRDRSEETQHRRACRAVDSRAAAAEDRGRECLTQPAGRTGWRAD